MIVLRLQTLLRSELERLRTAALLLAGTALFLVLAWAMLTAVFLLG